jgi:hypothetical protein
VEFIKFLQASIGTGEILSLAYAGGSRPGESREIVVLGMTKDELEGVEQGSSIRKRYKLDKVLWVAPLEGGRIENIRAQSALHLLRLESLSEYAALLRPELESAGWHIHQDDCSLGVGGFFKNGKPKKTPSIAVRYFDRSTELAWDTELNDFVEVKRELTGRERPWRVDSWRFKEGKAFGELHKAMTVFLEEVRASSAVESSGMFAGH